MNADETRLPRLCLEEQLNEIRRDIVSCKKCHSGDGFVSCGKAPDIYCGSDDIKVLIIGHSPAIKNKRRVETVLDFDREKSNLRRYIADNLLDPLGITIENIYCTNLMKCFTDELPESKEKKSPGTIKAITDNCFSLLEKEILAVNPKIVISLSETVLKIMTTRFIGKALRMKESFARPFDIAIQGKTYTYIPIVHIPKPRIKDHYFPEQTERLKALRSILLT